MTEMYTLPCFNHIATGDCGFKNRCKFIHDPRLSCKGSKSYRIKISNKEPNFDSFYWVPLKCERDEINNLKHYNPKVNCDIRTLRTEKIWENFIESINN